ncbi:MAG: hypothetical protein KF897_06240 [Opitutaceae bacterium]|nr:hypothetical protein [Opitutaceae bacterium]
MRVFSLTTSLALGGALVVAYVVAACFRREKPVLSEAGTVFVSASGVIGGINVFVRCLDELTSPVQGEERIYFAFAGLTMIWLSIASVLDALGKGKYFQSRPQGTANESA